jgi:hypothetical protein
MRNLAIGGAILVVFLGGILFLVLKPFHPSTGSGICPPTSGTGPPSPVHYSDQFTNVAPAGSALVMKPNTRLPSTYPGLCIDQASGDIHLYHKQATQVQLDLTLDPTLHLLWPTDPIAAFDVSPQAVYQPATVSTDQKTLTVFLLAKDQGQKYPYVATYLDSQGNPFHTEPGIQNH